MCLSIESAELLFPKAIQTLKDNFPTADVKKLIERKMLILDIIDNQLWCSLISDCLLGTINMYWEDKWVVRWVF